MIRVAPSEIRARRRPLAVLFVYAAELAWALVVATPVHAWARRAWGAHPDGDAVLFRAGGRELLMWLGQTDAALPVSVRTMLLLLFVGAVLMQLPLGALLASLAFARHPAEGVASSRRSLRPVEALRIGMGAFMPLSGALALGTVAGIIVVALGAIASSAVDHGFVESLGDARSFHLRLVTFGLFLIVAAVVGVFVDLVRAAIVRETGTAATSDRSSTSSPAPAWTVMLRGVKTALRAARRDLVRATVGWAWRYALGLVLIGTGYYAARALGGRGGGALVALFAIHQVVVLGRVALRASWLARALVIVAPVQDARDDVQNTPVDDATPEPAPLAATEKTQP